MRILIAVYGSVYDDAAVSLGAQIAQHARVAPTLLAVVARAGGNADALLARAQQALAHDRPDAEARMEVGSVVDRILHLAREEGYDLVVIGEGESAHSLLRWRSEPVGVHVVKDAPCPILVVKGQARPIRRILLCDSGAGNPAINPFYEGHAPIFQGGLGPPQGAITPLRQFVTELAETLAGDEEVTVLHVMSQIGASPRARDRQLHADAQELIEEHTPEGELLEADLQMLSLPGVHSRATVRHGLVVDEILAQAREGDYDLVMIGAHRAPGWQRFLLDDLASQIVRQIDRPVLVV